MYRGKVKKTDSFLDGLIHSCNSIIYIDYTTTTECFSYNATLDYWAYSGR